MLEDVAISSNKSKVFRSSLDVNFYHSTIAVGESLDSILNNLLQESYQLIPKCNSVLMYIK